MTSQRMVHGARYTTIFSNNMVFNFRLFVSPLKYHFTFDCVNKKELN